MYQISAALTELDSHRYNILIAQKTLHYISNVNIIINNNKLYKNILVDRFTLIEKNRRRFTLLFVAVTKILPGLFFILTNLPNE